MVYTYVRTPELFLFYFIILFLDIDYSLLFCDRLITSKRMYVANLKHCLKSIFVIGSENV